MTDFPKDPLTFGSPNQFPTWDFPEIPMIGRSNSGKSSLTNALCQRKWARVGATPGRTQLIHMYPWQQRLLVDLPGYGTVKTGKSMQKKWPKLMGAYMVRTNIQHILFLMDIRRDFRPEDLDLLGSLGCQQTILVLTKSDKIKRNDINNRQVKLAGLLEQAGFPVPMMIAISNLKKTGHAQLTEVLTRPQ